MQFATHVKWRGEKFGAVVFDTLNEKVHVTNETGGDILRLVSEGLSAEEIVTALQPDYEGDPSQIAGDTRAFIDGLVAARFLVQGAEDGP